MSVKTDTEKSDIPEPREALFVYMSRLVSLLVRDHEVVAVSPAMPIGVVKVTSVEDDDNIDADFEDPEIFGEVFATQNFRRDCNPHIQSKPGISRVDVSVDSPKPILPAGDLAVHHLMNNMGNTAKFSFAQHCANVAELLRKHYNAMDDDTLESTRKALRKYIILSCYKKMMRRLSTVMALPVACE
jgi:hypothetical protein